MQKPLSRVATPLLVGVALVAAVAASPSRAATPTADYLLTFDATWSEETHPGMLPPGPHFSPIVVALHNDQASFWTVGGLASNGIERMAEAGATNFLMLAINAEVTQGNADYGVVGADIPLSPGTIGQNFTAQQAFPLLTVVSMVAPSPDWFVGIDSVPLMNPNGTWRFHIEIPLYVYDAGTDSGPTFTSPDDDTQPPEPISLFDTGPFAPPMQFVGTFTITRTDMPPPVPASGPVSIAILVIALLGTGFLGASLIGRRQGVAG